MAKAYWRREVEVAVKSVPLSEHSNSHSEERIKLLQEAVMMGQFRHPNVVQLHGIATAGTSVSLRGHICSNDAVFALVFEVPYGAMAESLVCYCLQQMSFRRKQWEPSHVSLTCFCHCCCYIHAYMCVDIDTGSVSVLSIVHVGPGLPSKG